MPKFPVPFTNNTNSVSPSLVLPLNSTDIMDMKLNQDRYEVYVNGEFLGEKSLKTQGEKLSDIDDFLVLQGISDFSSSCEGDHYNITTDGNKNSIVHALSIYFQNR